MNMVVVRRTSFCLFILAWCSSTLAQAGPTVLASRSPTSQQLELAQVLQILGLTETVQRLQVLQGQDKCGAIAASPEELTLRVDLMESVQMASLDVDAVTGMIANERGKLSNLQTSLKATRDKTVARLNAAALITGSGIGAAVSATQFMTVEAGLTMWETVSA